MTTLRRALSALAATAMILLAASAVAADTPLLRVDRETGVARLNWTGGTSDYVVYQSADPSRVVSPARVATTTPAADWRRSDDVADPNVLFFQVSCPGAGCDETCFDGVDNDGDGSIDCADSDCVGSVDCVPETECTDGLDNEGDDLADCADPDCHVPCEDNDACTVDNCDPLAVGGCRNDPVNCDDLDACTVDTCDAILGCQHAPLNCDDSDECTVDTCDVLLGCQHAPVNCDDNDACTTDSCDPVLGCQNAPVNCDDGDECTTDSCDPVLGCQHVAVNCDDGDVCTTDSCDVLLGCQHVAINCDDSDACTADTCDALLGCQHAAVNCDDNDACTTDSCDVLLGCQHVAVNCDDGDACTIDTCDALLGCQHAPVNCSDGDACTTDTCDVILGCQFAAVVCDDRDACNGLETCNPADGLCRPGTPVTCSDANLCTDDVCDPSTGACSFPARACDDGNPCTIDTCDPATGCVATSDPNATVGQQAQLAGNQLSQYPFFEYARAFNVNADIEVAIDPILNAAVAGQTCDVYVVAPRTGAGWCANQDLSDVRGAPDTRVFGGANIQASTHPLVAANVLSAAAGQGIGAPYDVVLDCNRNGRLDNTDWIDGGRPGLTPEAGMYVVHDLTTAGPLAVSVHLNVGPLSDAGNQADWAPEGDDYRVAYPSVLDDPAYVGQFPMIVLGHGNGHAPDWYHDIQGHLASYGFIVFAHDNHTIPGIETASSSTLYWTDKFIAEDATIVPGGILDGHLARTQIIWVGHSRGGEGVARAYDRIRDEGFTPAEFGLSDIKLVISMAPTDFLGGGQSNAGAVTYGLLYGAQDNDVNGCTSNDVATSFNLFERATGVRASHYVHGANHAWFHDCNGQEDQPLFETPPEPIPCPEQQKVQFGWMLAYVKRVIEGNVPAKDFLWRQYESLRPIGVAGTTKVVNDYRDPEASTFVLDDYETEIATNRASAGGTVTSTVSNLSENICDDGNTGFDWGTGTDAMNGMTRANRVTGTLDDPRCTVFNFTSASQLQIDLLAGQRDWSAGGYLSMRACQGTRHPNTTAVLENLTFTVTLVDGAARTSSINIGAYGGGIQEPYQRRGGPLTGCTDGTANGWGNEFEVIRIRLADFLRNGSNLDLANIVSLRLDFSGTSGSAQGRLGLDDIRLSPE